MDTVVPYLRSRGIIGTQSAQAAQLGGGVSNVVLAVSDGTCDVVVKQSLDRLRVEDEWTAPTRRSLTEAVALQLVRQWTRDAVPEVIDVDASRHCLVISQAPAGWTDWKTLLLRGRVDRVVAQRVGELLGTWHTATRDPVTMPERLDDQEALDRLRLDPYYATVARRIPELSQYLHPLMAQLRSSRICLVHGDFSPKNILVGADRRLWVIDFEVAHRGDPAFDLAFLLTHFALKAVHLPALAARIDACAEAFVAGYCTRCAPELYPDMSYVSRHVGGMLLARVRGKSPAEYLTDDERQIAWRVGRTLLMDGATTVADLCATRQRLLG